MGNRHTTRHISSRRSSVRSEFSYPDPRRDCYDDWEIYYLEVELDTLPPHARQKIDVRVHEYTHEMIHSGEECCTEKERISNEEEGSEKGIISTDEECAGEKTISKEEKCASEDIRDDLVQSPSLKRLEKNDIIKLSLHNDKVRRRGSLTKTSNSVFSDLNFQAIDSVWCNYKRTSFGVSPPPNRVFSQRGDCDSKTVSSPDDDFANAKELSCSEVKANEAKKVSLHNEQTDRRSNDILLQWELSLDGLCLQEKRKNVTGCTQRDCTIKGTFLSEDKSSGPTIDSEEESRDQTRSFPSDSLAQQTEGTSEDCPRKTIPATPSKHLRPLPHLPPHTPTSDPIPIPGVNSMVTSSGGQRRDVGPIRRKLTAPSLWLQRMMTSPRLAARRRFSLKDEPGWIPNPLDSDSDTDDFDDSGVFSDNTGTPPRSPAVVKHQNRPASACSSNVVVSSSISSTTSCNSEVFLSDNGVTPPLSPATKHRHLIVGASSCSRAPLCPLTKHQNPTAGVGESSRSCVTINLPDSADVADTSSSPPRSGNASLTLGFPSLSSSSSSQEYPNTPKTLDSSSCNSPLRSPTVPQTLSVPSSSSFSSSRKSSTAPQTLVLPSEQQHKDFPLDQQQPSSSSSSSSGKYVNAPQTCDSPSCPSSRSVNAPQTLALPSGQQHKNLSLDQQQSSSSSSSSRRSYTAPQTLALPSGQQHNDGQALGQLQPSAARLHRKRLALQVGRRRHNSEPTPLSPAIEDGKEFLTTKEDARSSSFDDDDSPTTPKSDSFRWRLVRLMWGRKKKKPKATEAEMAARASEKVQEDQKEARDLAEELQWMTTESSVPPTPSSDNTDLDFGQDQGCIINEISVPPTPSSDNGDFDFSDQSLNPRSPEHFEWHPNETSEPLTPSLDTTGFDFRSAKSASLKKRERQQQYNIDEDHVSSTSERKVSFLDYPRDTRKKSPRYSSRPPRSHSSSPSSTTARYIIRQSTTVMASQDAKKKSPLSPPFHLDAYDGSFPSVITSAQSSSSQKTYGGARCSASSRVSTSEHPQDTIYSTSSRVSTSDHPQDARCSKTSRVSTSQLPQGARRSTTSRGSTSEHPRDAVPNAVEEALELDWLCEPEWNNLELELFWSVLRPYLERLLEPGAGDELPEPCVLVCAMDRQDHVMLDRCLMHVQCHIWKGNYCQAVADFRAIRRHFRCYAESHLIESDTRDDVESLRMVFQRKRPSMFRFWI